MREGVTSQNKPCVPCSPDPPWRGLSFPWGSPFCISSPFKPLTSDYRSNMYMVIGENFSIKKEQK
jgi:hypothetical protein